MGNSHRTHRDYASIDLVGPLSQNQRKERLINGYIHSIKKLQKRIPNDILSILNMYLQNMCEIKTPTEIEEERKRREYVCTFLSFSNEL